MILAVQNSIQLETPLHFLPSFLGCARQEMPGVAKAVRDDHLSEQNPLVLAEKYIVGGPEKVSASVPPQKFAREFLGQAG